MRPFASVAIAVMLLAAPVLGCVGDCDDDGAVGIDELVIGVEIGLGQLGVDRCPAMDGNGDGVVAIPELVAAVEAGLGECLAGATPTPTTGRRPAALRQRRHRGRRAVRRRQSSSTATAAPRPVSSRAHLQRSVRRDRAGLPGTAIKPVRVASGLSSPVLVTAPPRDPQPHLHRRAERHASAS